MPTAARKNAAPCEEHGRPETDECRPDGMKHAKLQAFLCKHNFSAFLVFS